MGIMPEDRPRRWRAIFRRYGIPTGIEETREANDAEAKLEQLKQGARDALLPEGLLGPEKKPVSRPKRR